MHRDDAYAGEPPFSGRGIHKAFGGIPVLKGIDLDLHPGEVVALAGENGAGKSTLMKIIAGQVIADMGDLSIAGVAQHRFNSVAAARAGIAIVPQELAPVPDMTVAENIFLGRETTSAAVFLRSAAMRSESRRLLRDFGLDIDPRTPMRDLTVAMQQIIEIIKITTVGARVILLDEPSSAISVREVDRLYQIIDRLRGEGVAIVLTTHKMEEIRATADRVIVLRDGRLIVDTAAAGITDDGIVTAMIGRELEDLFPVRVSRADGEPVLEVSGVTVDGFASSVDLTVRAGEIVGLAGLVGAGRTELLEALFGIRGRRGGEVRVGGRVLRIQSPRTAIAARMAFVPEDRKRAGLVLSMSIRDNGILPHLSQFSVGSWVRQRAATRRIDEVMQSMRLKRASLSQSVSLLSGGNQQKVVLGRWLTGDIRLLLLDEPTRGVDIGARSEMYRIIADLAASGVAILMASSDMAEVIGLSHRVLVVREGGIAGELTADELDHTAQDAIFRHAAGLTHGNDKEVAR
ncbi:sugar ABC transporter ATP-binding protein [Microbacterium allomyrinae]|nr:sugar ABC transporter ATP-binding protein [Microbacterium allomyrinae]